MRTLGTQGRSSSFSRRDGFYRITDKKDIVIALREIMHSKQFVATIVQRRGATFNGLVFNGGNRLECFSVLSIVSSEDDTAIDLTSSDVGYQRSVGRVMLSDIEYIETLRPVTVTESEP